MDSGSQDGTLEYARDAGCTIIEIPSAEFSHSHARNLGAINSRGDFLLFMVQDAYPIGEYWAYGMLRYLLDHEDENLAAVSCSEFSRSDSDMMYDSMIDIHYRFLGCLDYDRIGEYKGDDHTSLRANGQLSDVACLIKREVFASYRFEGDYAEDLRLGIRLIKDGYRVAMLASVKVIHSHNRPAYYYLKRSFVDVVFLVNIFDDFSYPQVRSISGLIAGIVSTAAHLSNWLAGYDETASQRTVHEDIENWITAWRRDFDRLCLDTPSRLGDPQVDAYIDSLAKRYLEPNGKLLDARLHNEARMFLDMFLDRLWRFNSFASTVYDHQDAGLRQEIRNALCKTFCSAAGSSLGFLYMSFVKSEGSERSIAESIYHELRVGI